MAFTIFTSTSIADADELMDNFYHVFQGDRLPMGGVSLAAADNTYDLGASATRWNNIYCENLYVSNSIACDTIGWFLVDYVELTTTASSITFSGLNGDDYIEYKIDFFWKGGTTASDYARMYINTDSGTNYGFNRISAYNAGISGNLNNSFTQVWFEYIADTTSGSLRTYNSVTFRSKTGYVRPFNVFTPRSIDNKYVYGLTFMGEVWGDTSNTITSIKFEVGQANNFTPDTKIIIWGKK